MGRLDPRNILLGSQLCLAVNLMWMTGQRLLFKRGGEGERTGTDYIFMVQN